MEEDLFNLMTNQNDILEKMESYVEAINGLENLEPINDKLGKIVTYLDNIDDAMGRIVAQLARIADALQK
jgi:uncharacterized protein Yka (UPF0111/DUF47 family)